MRCIAHKTFAIPAGIPAGNDCQALQACIGRCFSWCIRTRVRRSRLQNVSWQMMSCVPTAEGNADHGHILHPRTRWAGAHLHEVVAGVEPQGLEGVQAGCQLGALEALQRQPHGARQRLQQALGWLMLQPTAGLQDQGQALQTIMELNAMFPMLFTTLCDLEHS